VSRVEYEKLSDDRLGEASAVIQKRVEAARQCQRLQRRYAPGGGAQVLRIGRYGTFVDEDSDEPAVLCSLAPRCSLAPLSARAYHRILKAFSPAGTDDCRFRGR